MIQPAAPASGSWMAALPAERRARLRELQAIDLRWNLIGLGYLAAWALLGWAVVTFPHWAVRLPGYFLIGALIQALAILMHDGVHGSLFRNKALERAVGILLGAPHLIPFSAFKVTHLLHHRHSRGALDPDELMEIARTPRLQAVAFYWWLLMGMPFYLANLPVVALRRATASERVAVIVDLVVLAALYGGVAWAAVTSDTVRQWVLHAWALPFLWTCVFGNVRGIAEHQLTVRDAPTTETRTITSNRAVSLLMCNLNYHLEHHLLPATPWYRLPQLHRLLSPQYPALGANVHRSYLRFLWTAIRRGVHGVALTPSPPREPR